MASYYSMVKAILLCILIKWVRKVQLFWFSSKRDILPIKTYTQHITMIMFNLTDDTNRKLSIIKCCVRELNTNHICWSLPHLNIKRNCSRKMPHATHTIHNKIQIDSIGFYRSYMHKYMCVCCCAFKQSEI